MGQISPNVPADKTGRLPFAVETMVRIDFMQQWLGLSDPAMEETVHGAPPHSKMARCDTGVSRLPGESTTLPLRP